MFKVRIDSREYIVYAVAGGVHNPTVSSIRGKSVYSDPAFLIKGSSGWVWINPKDYASVEPVEDN